jgi:hypothetical protein
MQKPVFLDNLTQTQSDELQKYCFLRQLLNVTMLYMWLIEDLKKKLDASLNGWGF